MERKNSMNQKKDGAIDRKRTLGPVDTDVSIFDTDCVVSTTECTGLTPAMVLDEEEVDSYTEIYNIPLSDDPKGNKEDKNGGRV